MHTFERAVKFEDVDAAGIVFFARFFAYAHDAMADLFSPLEGGYARLVTVRRVGLPAVHAEADFRAPLRFGDVVSIEVTTTHIGETSCSFRFVLSRKADGQVVAVVKQTCVVTDMNRLKGIVIPDDVLAVLKRALVTPA